MITPKELAAAFGRNASICASQCKGLDHADSLLQPAHRGNCLNWVLGHIVGSRDTILQALGAEAIVGEEKKARYGYGSNPVLADGDDLLRLEELLSLLASSQETLAEKLSALREQGLGEAVDSFMGEGTTLGQLLFFLYFHETYHTGQTEYLRQLTDVNDKVI